MYRFKNYRNCRGGKGLKDHLAQVLGYGSRIRDRETKSNNKGGVAGLEAGLEVGQCSSH